MPIAKSDPIYPISVAAKLLGVHPRTIRIYEEEGLIKPARQGQKRFFSSDDIDWIQCLRHLIHDEGISIPGIRKLLELSPCWDIKGCPEEKRKECSAYTDRTVPCWERKSSACARETDGCLSCDVFIQAMKAAKDKTAGEGTGRPAEESGIRRDPSAAPAVGRLAPPPHHADDHRYPSDLEQDAGIPILRVKY